MRLSFYGIYLNIFSTDGVPSTKIASVSRHPSSAAAFSPPAEHILRRSKRSCGNIYSSLTNLNCPLFSAFFTGILSSPPLYSILFHNARKGHLPAAFSTGCQNFRSQTNSLQTAVFIKKKKLYDLTPCRSGKEEPCENVRVRQRPHRLRSQQRPAAVRSAAWVK